MKLHFFKRRECLVPTGATWSLAGAVILLCVAAYVFGIQGFLAPVKAVEADILVTEGWLPEYALGQAAADFKTKGYRLLIVTGGPVETGHFLSGYKSLATVGARTLTKLGVDSARIVVAPSPFVRKDRTYEEAVALKHWLERSEIPEKSLNLYSIGVHSRRSQLLFSRVLGKKYSVGIVACEDKG